MPHTLPPLPSLHLLPKASLAALRASEPDREIVETFTMLATCPMQLALYFCTGQIPDIVGWRCVGEGGDSKMKRGFRS